MPYLSDGIVNRLAVMVLTPQGEGGAHYVRHNCNRTRDEKYIREAFLERCTPEARAAMPTLAPWLYVDMRKDTLADTISAKLEDAGPMGLSRTALRIATGDQEEYGDAIAALVHAGKVLVSKRVGEFGGRPAIIYRHAMYREPGEPTDQTPTGLPQIVDPFEQAREVVRRARLAAGEPVDGG